MRPKWAAAVTMNRLPAFEQMLTARARDVISGNDANADAIFRRTSTRYLPLPGMIKRQTCREIVRLLERKMAPALVALESPIPEDSITGMKYDYSETLQKTMRMRTGALNGRARAVEVARTLGILDLLRSDAVRQFAERVSGYELNPDVGCQVLRYGPGDYVGAHNDHHPESATTRDGYVDVQMTFVSEGVESQWLLYEQKGHLNQMVDVNRSGLISTYFLPFWHMTTPLVARRGCEATAARWLLLATYELKEPRLLAKPNRKRA